MRRKIDVTRAELLELRNQGYSNKEIAEMLDISYQTVFNWIGKQGFRNAPKQEQEPVVETPSVKVITQTVSVDGFLFEINNSAKCVKVATGDSSFLLLKEEELDKFSSAFALVKSFIGW